MGASGLNYDRFKRKQIKSDLCNYCKVPETITHFLLHCKLFEKWRYKYLSKFISGNSFLDFNQILSLLNSDLIVEQDLIFRLIMFIYKSKRFCVPFF